MKVVGLAMVVAVVTACSSSTEDPPGNSSGSSGSSGSSSSSGASGVTPTCNGNEGGPVPADAAAMKTWLETGAYKCWAHESTKHPSTGPHGGDVQTYLNAALDASMKGSAEHPKDAVAVKELYGSGTTVAGYAVMVKTQAASAAGQGYYWYELLPGGSIIEGQGKSLCVNCHAGGKDYVLVPYPLR